MTISEHQPLMGRGLQRLGLVRQEPRQSVMWLGQDQRLGTHGEYLKRGRIHLSRMSTKTQARHSSDVDVASRILAWGSEPCEP